MGLLVESGQVDWDTRVIEHLPEFKTTYSPKVGGQATLRDLLLHSTGLAPLLFSILGKNAAILPRREDIVHDCSKLPFRAQFRSEWKYNNWPYALAARIIEVRSGTSWQSQIHGILKALGMHRSFTTNPDDENLAHGYKVFNDGRMSEDGLPLLQGGDEFDGSGSFRSCVNDMITWCKVPIQAIRTQPLLDDNSERICSPGLASGMIESSHGLTTHSVLKALRTAVQPQVPLANDSRQAYGLGHYSFHLPRHEINTVTNGHVPEIMHGYTLGAGSSPMAVIGHTGDLGSFTNTYWAFPETESAVIVMTNASSTYGDSSNIVAQVLIQALFEMQPAIDYEKLASRVVANAKAKWQEVFDAWSAQRKAGTQPRGLAAYVGIYMSTDLRMTLKINTVGEDSLRLCINGLPDQIFDLYHYHLDTWTFFPKSHDQCLEMGMGYYLHNWERFNVGFERLAEGLGTFRGLTWPFDLDSRADPPLFSRIGA